MTMAWSLLCVYPPTCECSTGKVDEMLFSSTTRSAFFPLLVTSLWLSGCASPAQRGWGGEVTLSPGWSKFRGAAVNAARDPATWLPALGAVVVQASGRDRELTRSAMGDGGVYDSSHEAAVSSDRHRTQLDQLWMLSLVATDSGPDEVFSNKLNGALTQAAIINASIATTNGLKSVIRRSGPGEEMQADNYQGFPSNHSVPPFTQAALVRRNLHYTPVNSFARYSLVSASYALASASAYGRVEAGLHFLSDQLAGAALGNFLGLLMYDTFFEENKAWSITLTPSLNRHHAALGVRRRF